MTFEDQVPAGIDAPTNISGAARCHGIVPPYLLARLAEHADPRVARSARSSLLTDQGHRERRTSRGTAARSARPWAEPTVQPEVHDDGTSPLRTIHDAHGSQVLPGTVVRTEGAPPVGDAAADEAYDGLGATWALYRDAYGRDSLDDRGLPLDASVHYGQDYDNAFWNGTQMVFGDGDGTVFERFTIAVDVIGHELTHGVTQFTAGLVYQGQSGALNESVSDVFGSLVKQRGLGQDAASADWLIGAGLFTASVHGVALRSMKAPGTAYDDPVLGKDPQPATMAGYVQTEDDNGGVHLNSGIPNRAFYLAATAIGGYAWQGAGQVWYDVLTGGRLPADADFATFARATVGAAQARFGAESPQASAVQEAWLQVGVLNRRESLRRAADARPEAAARSADAARPGTAGRPADAVPAPTVPATGGSSAPRARHSHGDDSSPEQVLVERTGGFAGLRVTRDVDLTAIPSDEADAWRSLLGSPLLRGLTAEPAQADRYTYRVACRPVGIDVTAAEQQLPGHVLDLLERSLRRV